MRGRETKERSSYIDEEKNNTKLAKKVGKEKVGHYNGNLEISQRYIWTLLHLLVQSVDPVFTHSEISRRVYAIIERAYRSNNDLLIGIENWYRKLHSHPPFFICLDMLISLFSHLIDAVLSCNYSRTTGRRDKKKKKRGKWDAHAYTRARRDERVAFSCSRDRANRGCKTGAARA